MRFSTIAALCISIAATAIAAPMADPAIASGGLAGQCNNSDGCSGTAGGAAGNLSGGCSGDTCSGAAAGSTKRDIEAVEIEERAISNSYTCSGAGCKGGLSDGIAIPINTKEKRQATNSNQYSCKGLHCQVSAAGAVTAPTAVVQSSPTKVRRDQSLVANASGQATGACDNTGSANTPQCSGTLSGTFDPTY
ncbi:hypothetical protein K490DRAFT_60606 [Saccharata proteae CBS 121410]|uniref:Uncharacterized protein n=1 Tax=Saccharata proteae CBS 121410 TaxID=1314787 RepID=A0A9P4HMK5_9PEZI|nr:hypothetical protein K490DRAFT_60606 [Saccharata proteae CBS 121410]